MKQLSISELCISPLQPALLSNNYYLSGQLFQPRQDITHWSLRSREVGFDQFSNLSNEDRVPPVLNGIKSGKNVKKCLLAYRRAWSGNFVAS